MSSRKTMDGIKVVVCGARGRMGSLIVQSILESSDLRLVGAFDFKDVGMDLGCTKISHPSELDSALDGMDAQVLVDFTSPDSVQENVSIAASHGLDLVVGTTGYTQQHFQKMRESILRNGVAAVISPNFSLGMNLMFKIAEMLSKHIQDFEIEIMEMHHSSKLDSPSGTALKLAELIGPELIPKFGRAGRSPRGKSEVGIHALRGGDVMGEHTIFLLGRAERLEITHRVQSRQAFADGALRAIRWVVNAPPGIYSMKDVLGL